MSLNILRVVASGHEKTNSSNHQWPTPMGLNRLRVQLNQLFDQEEFGLMPDVLKQINLEYHCSYTDEKARHRDAILTLLDNIKQDLPIGDHAALYEQMSHIENTIAHFDPYLSKEQKA